LHSSRKKYEHEKELVISSIRAERN
jgi:hypothetical protein